MGPWLSLDVRAKHEEHAHPPWRTDFQLAASLALSMLLRRYRTKHRVDASYVLFNGKSLSL